MVHSMTGFGRAEGVVNNRQVIVEIKSLNGKQFEMGTKSLPSLLRAYELPLRNKLATLLQRGTIDFSISIKQGGVSKPMTINKELAKSYYQGMQQLAEELGINQDNLLATLMTMPEVVAADQDTISEEEWQALEQLITQAAHHLSMHRSKEGQVLKADLEEKIINIEKLLAQALVLEPQRLEKVKQRMQQSLQTMVGAESVDTNRFEQELIYYLERMDISEEKIRLQQHCHYFHEIINDTELVKGKKLGFVLQEIGREINTLGAKANHAEMQKLVIAMKDELEKAKEQILNVL